MKDADTKKLKEEIRSYSTDLRRKVYMLKRIKEKKEKKYQEKTFTISTRTTTNTRTFGTHNENYLRHLQTQQVKVQRKTMAIRKLKLSMNGHSDLYKK